MSKRASLKESEGARGLDALFSPGAVQQHARKLVYQKDSKTELAAVKATFYLGPDVVDLIEEVRLRLRREFGLAPREASKSSIVEAALKLQSGDIAALAEQIKGSASA